MFDRINMTDDKRDKTTERQAWMSLSDCHGNNIKEYG